MQALYISYDGVLEPLGESQVLRYLERLTPDQKFILLSFEKRRDWQRTESRESLRKKMRELGIRWIPLRYHKSPSAVSTAYDMGVGLLVGIWVVLRYRPYVVHARSYVAAVIALVLKKLFSLKFIFDMRGFWADERVDGFLWKRQSVFFMTAKWFERHFLLSADHIVTLTHASVPIIENFKYLRGRTLTISVIPTCADLETFYLSNKRETSNFNFGYVGSVGTWYLFDETLLFFKALMLRRRNAKLIVVNRNEHPRIQAAVAQAGIDLSRLYLVALDHRNVSDAIRKMHVASAFIRPCFSKIASAPTKLAEYLGCGVPCLSNSGIGDMKNILEQNNVGVVLPDFSESSIAEAVDEVLTLVDDPCVAQRCRETAERLFSLDVGVDSYKKIYASIRGSAR
jgi:glycosyltransferase involved in cell wall biosynthesis